MARIVRGQVLTLKNQEFVLAAQAMGVQNLAIFFRHILPNILGNHCSLCYFDNSSGNAIGGIFKLSWTRGATSNE